MGEAATAAPNALPIKGEKEPWEIDLSDTDLSLSAQRRRR